MLVEIIILCSLSNHYLIINCLCNSKAALLHYTRHKAVKKLTGDRKLWLVKKKIIFFRGKKIIKNVSVLNFPLNNNSLFLITVC